MGLAASRQEAFWESCGFGNIERARHFLKEGDIDVNWVSYTNDCCPIHVASQGKPEIVQLLLEHKCDVNVRDNRGNLPIHHAAMKGHADIVQTLLDAGCDINGQEKNGWTALHNAAYWCRPDVIRVLIKNGCDVHLQNKDERTALHECSRSQSRDEKKLGEIAQRLIDAGSDINSKSSDWGEADLTGLMYASFHNHPDVASVLIQAGSELNSVGTTFWTALHWAADRDNDELVYILLDAGIDATIRDMRGETAADRAQTDDIKDLIITAIDIQKELNRVKNPVIRPAVQLRKPEEPFKPKCDANFKSKSFLPKDWKPSNPVNVKNLINEKKSRLAAMTSQKYRTELAKRTDTSVIRDEDVKKCENEVVNKCENEDVKKSENAIENKCENEVVNKCTNPMNESDTLCESKDEKITGDLESEGSNDGNDSVDIDKVNCGSDSKQSEYDDEDVRESNTDETGDNKPTEPSDADREKGDETDPDKESGSNKNNVFENPVSEQEAHKEIEEKKEQGPEDTNNVTEVKDVNVSTTEDNKTAIQSDIREQTEKVEDSEFTDDSDEFKSDSKKDTCAESKAETVV